MKPVSISDMIGLRLGKDVQESYNRLLDHERRSILKYGLNVGMRLGRSVMGEELPEDYVEEIYKTWVEMRK